MLMMAGLICLFMFQHIAFSTRLTNNTDFWNFSAPGALGVFNILEFIWAFQFLRDACNSILIQSTSVLLVAPLTGTGAPIKQNVPPHSSVCSNIGAVSSLVPS